MAFLNIIDSLNLISTPKFTNTSFASEWLDSIDPCSGNPPEDRQLEVGVLDLSSRPALPRIPEIDSSLQISLHPAVERMIKKDQKKFAGYAADLDKTLNDSNRGLKALRAKAKYLVDRMHVELKRFRMEFLGVED